MTETINYQDTLEITYSVNNETEELENIIDIKVNDNSKTISDLENDGDEFKKLQKFTWSPDKENVGNTYTFKIGGEDLSIKVTDVPDSVIYHYPMLDRDNNIIEDAVGNEDGTAEGTTNVSNNYWEGFAEDGDGTDEWIRLTKLGDYGSQLDKELAIAFTVDGFTETDSPNYNVIAVDSNVQLYIQFSASNAGDLQATFADENSDIVRTRTPDGGFVNDGEKHRVVINKTGNNASDIEVWVDGDKKPISEMSDDNPTNFADFEDDVGVLARHEGGGSIDTPTPMVIDNLQFHDPGTSLTDAEIDEDYNKQPWT